MALGTSNISTTLVRNTIGESTNKVSELVLSPNVNYFGFNATDVYLNTFWGKDVAGRTDTEYGYPLGLFRGYDHDWVTRMYGGVTRLDSDPVSEPTRLRISLVLAAPYLIDKPDVDTVHTFTVEVSSTNNFHQGGGTVIMSSSSKTINNNGNTFDVSFNHDDIGLGEGDTFYVNVIHETSAARRWFIVGEPLSVCNQGGDNYISNHTVPLDPYNYTVSISDTTANINLYNGRENACYGTVSLNGSFRTTTTVTILLEFSESSNFDTNVKSHTFDVTMQSGESTSASDTFSTSSLISWSVGDSVYYRYKINGVTSGDTLSYSTTFTSPATPITVKDEQFDPIT